MIFYICKYCKKSILLSDKRILPEKCTHCDRYAVIDSPFTNEYSVVIPIQVGDNTWPNTEDILFEVTYKRIALFTLDYVFNLLSKRIKSDYIDPVVVKSSFEKGLLSFNILVSYVLDIDELDLITNFIREKLDDSLYCYRKSIKG